MNFYNDNDPKCAAWLRELINAGLIPQGIVDERSITEIQPNELKPYRQCHFFAGIGGWSYALQLADWPDDHPVWTGSCPCQPISGAGLKKGHADERHMWPAFYHLISECKPATVFGEQVAGKDGREWLAGVRADMEGIGYACGGSDLCAAGVGSPHVRQRLFWVVHSNSQRGCSRITGSQHATNVGVSGQDGYWSKFETVNCTDKKQRRIEPGSFPVAHGVSNGVGLTRGYGNAIVPQLAAEFIGAFLDCTLT